MIITNQKFLSAYTFLAFDSIEFFKKELYLDFLNIIDVREIIREAFIPLLNSELDIYEDNVIVVFKINYLLKEILQTNFNKLIWWVRNIYIKGGGDRVSEWMWKDFCVEATRNQDILKNVDEKLRNKILTIGSEYLRRAKENDKKFNNLRSKFLTDFNKTIIKKFNLLEDAIETSISLITDANLLIELWDNEFKDSTYDEYMQIFNLGKEIIPKIMPGVKIQFPGNWLFEISEYRKQY